MLDILGDNTFAKGLMKEDEGAALSASDAGTSIERCASDDVRCVLAVVTPVFLRHVKKH